MVAQFNLHGHAGLADSQSQNPTLGAGDTTIFELRKKKFNEDFASWLALQNKHFEVHGLWCDGLVPWMSASFNGFSAD